MGLFDHFRDKLPKDKTEEELEEHYKNTDDLGKKDYLAMLIAAFITFVPVALAIILLFYGLLWILVVH